MKIWFELFITFLKLGTFTFGGGYAMISLLDSECVQKKKWITEDELMEITVIAESTPGPVAVNCATYTGYKKAGVLGAVFATIGMIIPSFIIILIISRFFDYFMKFELISKAFRGIRIAVGILIVQVAVKMIKTILMEVERIAVPVVMIILFGGIIIATDLIGFNISTIYLILAGGIMGFLIYLVKRKRRAL